MKTRFSKWIVPAALCVALTVSPLFIGCDRAIGKGPDFSTEYQAVSLDNGAIYYGKGEFLDSGFLLLKDVYTIETRLVGNSADVTSVLLKRGREWHAPDRMYINLQHVLYVEPVYAESKLAELIRESQKREAEEQAKANEKAAAKQ